jgi:hypothetical protein
MWALGKGVWMAKKTHTTKNGDSKKGLYFLSDGGRVMSDE